MTSNGTTLSYTTPIIYAPLTTPSFSGNVYTNTYYTNSAPVSIGFFAQANQSIPPGVLTKVTLPSGNFLPVHTGFSSQYWSTNGYEYTSLVSRNLYCNLWVKLVWQGNASGFRQLQIGMDGAKIHQTQVNAHSADELHTNDSFYIEFDPLGVLTFWVFQDSGVALNLQGVSGNTLISSQISLCAIN